MPKPPPFGADFAKLLGTGLVASLGPALGYALQDPTLTAGQIAGAVAVVGATVASAVAQGRLGNVADRALGQSPEPDWPAILGNQDLHRLTGEAAALEVRSFAAGPNVAQETTQAALARLAQALPEEWLAFGQTPGFSSTIRAFSNEELRAWTSASAQGQSSTASDHKFWNTLLMCVLQKHSLTLPVQVQSQLATHLHARFPHAVRQLLKQGGRAFHGYLLDWFATLAQQIELLRVENRDQHALTHDKLDELKGLVTHQPPPPATPITPQADWEQRAYVARPMQEAALREQLLGPAKPGAARVAYLYGMPGVGKTWLAEWFTAFVWREQHGQASLVLRFPLVFRDDQCQTTPDELLRWLCDAAQIPFGVAETAARLAAFAASPGVLLHLDNVDDDAAARAAAGLLGGLSGCTALVTGREQQFGQSRGWRAIPVQEFTPADAVQQLRNELRVASVPEERWPAEGELKDLARRLGYLPLALHLAASHLAQGWSCAEFLEELAVTGLALPPADRADERLTSDQARAVLSASFALSWKSFGRRAGPNASRWQPALASLGLAPLTGCGASLGAAIAGVEEAEFRRLVRCAGEFSLLTAGCDPARPEGQQETWRLHPLLAQWLRARADLPAAAVRQTAWFLERLEDPPEDDPGSSRWNEVHAEHAGLVEWLDRVPAKDAAEVVNAASSFAICNGPFAAWLELVERGLSGLPNDEERSWLLQSGAVIAGMCGIPDRALRLAEQALALGNKRDDEHEMARALGIKAGILLARGDWDQALRIYREEELPVYERLGEIREKAVTLGKIADVLQARGEYDEALRIRREEELPVYERLGDVRAKVDTLGRIADVLQARGEYDEALRIYEKEVLPACERLGDVRGKAVTLGKIADVLRRRGEYDEALRIYREEVLPVCERLGDVHEKTVTLGKIAAVHFARGEYDEVLRIRREEQLPVYERLGDVCSKATVLNYVADVHCARGEYVEALRIYRVETLPVYERLGAVREKASTLGRIADVLQARGEYDEALRIRHEEELPVYERLGEVRAKAITWGQIADVLQARGEYDKVLRIRREEELPVYGWLGDVRQLAYVHGKIADVFQARGEYDEALRIRREEQLPVYERLGDVHQKAVTLGKIADVLQARGEYDEALRIRQEEQLPVYERLGDVHQKAVTLGRIAAVHCARGEYDEALRIYRDEELPVYERLGDVRNLLVGHTSLALTLLKRGGAGDREEATELLRLARAAAERLRIPEVATIGQWQQHYGLE